MVKKASLLAVAVLGLYLLFSAFSILYQSRNALFWPQIKGHVISSSLVIHHLPKFLDWQADPMRWYSATVQYRYVIDYLPYFSNRLSFQKGETRESKNAMAIVNKYRKNQDVMVFYDPNDPSQSVLEPQDIEDTFMPILLGGLFVYLGFFAFRKSTVELDQGIAWYIQQGQIYQNQGKLEEALWQYNQAIRVGPNNVLGYMNRGNLYLQHNSLDRAIADFDQVIKLDPNNGLTYFTLAKAYLSKKDYQQAMLNVNKAEENGFNVRPDIIETIKRILNNSFIVFLVISFY